jgi:hypothetical protein
MGDGASLLHDRPVGAAEEIDVCAVERQRRGAGGGAGRVTKASLSPEEEVEGEQSGRLGMELDHLNSRRQKRWDESADL